MALLVKSRKSNEHFSKLATFEIIEFTYFAHNSQKSLAGKLKIPALELQKIWLLIAALIFLIDSVYNKLRTFLVSFPLSELPVLRFLTITSRKIQLASFNDPHLNCNESGYLLPP